VQNEKIIQCVKRTLKKQPEVMFAYIHGSILSSNNPRDIDAAAFLFPEVYKKLAGNGEVSIGMAIPLEMELAGKLNREVDFQILNNAPLSFRYSVITRGILVTDNDSNVRSNFEYLTRVEYFDFRPRFDEYLQEVMK